MSTTLRLPPQTPRPAGGPPFATRRRRSGRCGSPLPCRLARLPMSAAWAGVCYARATSAAPAAAGRGRDGAADLPQDVAPPEAAPRVVRNSRRPRAPDRSPAPAGAAADARWRVAEPDSCLCRPGGGPGSRWTRAGAGRRPSPPVRGGGSAAPAPPPAPPALGTSPSASGEGRSPTPTTRARRPGRRARHRRRPLYRRRRRPRHLRHGRRAVPVAAAEPGRGPGHPRALALRPGPGAELRGPVRLPARTVVTCECRLSPS